MFLYAGNDDPAYYDGQQPNPEYDYYELGEKLYLMDLPDGHHNKISGMVYDFFMNIGTPNGYNTVINLFSVTIRVQQQRLYYFCWYKIPYKRSVAFDEIKSIELREKYKGKRAERLGYPKDLFLHLHSGKRIFLGKTAHQKPGNAEAVSREFGELIGKPVIYAEP